jgi:hypothetical protein
MVMVIRYSDGSYVEGVLHRLAGATLRAAVAGIDDAVEYTLMHDKWISETGLPVTFEFPVEKAMDLCQIMPRQVMPGQVMPGMIGQLEAGCAAGGDCVLRRTSRSCASPVN